MYDLISEVPVNFVSILCQPINYIVHVICVCVCVFLSGGWNMECLFTRTFPVTCGCCRFGQKLQIAKPEEDSNDSVETLLRPIFKYRNNTAVTMHGEQTLHIVLRARAYFVTSALWAAYYCRPTFRLASPIFFSNQIWKHHMNTTDCEHTHTHTRVF